MAKNKVIPIDVQHGYFKDKNGQVFSPLQKKFDPICCQYLYPEYGQKVCGQVLSLDYTPKNLDLNTLDIDNIPKIQAVATAKITDLQLIKDIDSKKFTGYSLMWSGIMVTNEKLKLKLYLKIDEVSLTLTPAPRNPDCQNVEVLKNNKEIDTTSKSTEFKAQIVETLNVNIQGQTLNLVIENNVGEFRYDTKLEAKYGYIQGFLGLDGNDLDCYIGSDLTSQNIYQIEEVNRECILDEYKIMIGFASINEARRLFLDSTPAGLFNGIKKITINDLLQYKDHSYRFEFIKS